MWINRFLNWADRRNFVSIRGLAMYVTLYMTLYTIFRSFEYAHAAIDKPDLAVAAILTAINGPVCALQGYVFKWYTEAKKGE